MPFVRQTMSWVAVGSRPLSLGYRAAVTLHSSGLHGRYPDRPAPPAQQGRAFALAALGDVEQRAVGLEGPQQVALGSGRIPQAAADRAARELDDAQAQVVGAEAHLLGE